MLLVEGLLGLIAFLLGPRRLSFLTALPGRLPGAKIR